MAPRRGRRRDAFRSPQVATIVPVMPGWKVQWNPVVPSGAVNVVVITSPDVVVPVDRSSRSTVKLWAFEPSFVISTVTS
jgi:hypothetical protein